MWTTGTRLQRSTCRPRPGRRPWWRWATPSQTDTAPRPTEMTDGPMCWPQRLAGSSDRREHRRIQPGHRREPPAHRRVGAKCSGALRSRCAGAGGCAMGHCVRGSERSGRPGPERRGFRGGTCGTGRTGHRRVSADCLHARMRTACAFTGPRSRPMLAQPTTTPVRRASETGRR